MRPDDCKVYTFFFEKMFARAKATLQLVFIFLIYVQAASLTNKFLGGQKHDNRNYKGGV